MFWSIFIQCSAFIGATVIIGGIIGWLSDRNADKKN